jgi:Zn-dependent peptidase ImmA (M78 family)/transcriptional regulator with XRE-family HTH domain
MNRIKTLRLSRGLTQDELVKNMGGIITKQALSKYELGKSTPSSTVAVSLAKALGVKTVALFSEPKFSVKFVAYRKGSQLGVMKQEQIEGMLAEEVQKRLEVQERLGLGCNFLLKQQHVKSLEDAESAANYVRDVWDLGTDPIGNLTNVLEQRGVFVLTVEQAPERFHGISAFAYDVSNKVCGAGVAYKDGTVGERQRNTLSHELGHLVMNVHDSVDGEKAAHRFAGSLLAPAESLFNTLGNHRSHLDIEELRLLKQTFGVSMQALIYRAKDLSIITQNKCSELFQVFSKLGWRKNEPTPLPAEKPTMWQQLVTRALAEGQLTQEEASRWRVETEKPIVSNFSNPREFMKLPLSERRKLLEKQAILAADLYKTGSELLDWTENYIDDLDGVNA